MLIFYNSSIPNGPKIISSLDHMYTNTNKSNQPTTTIPSQPIVHAHVYVYMVLDKTVHVYKRRRATAGERE